MDLRRVAERAENQSEDSLLRRVAELVAADLKLGIDVGAWWSSRDGVGENRLVEFFWEIVLTNTTAPLVVLVDEIDAARTEIGERLRLSGASCIHGDGQSGAAGLVAELDQDLVGQ